MIALQTFYQNNFGSILQAFATKSFIESLQEKCDIICVENYKALCMKDLIRLNFNKMIKKIHHLLKFLIYPMYRDRYLAIKNIFIDDALNPQFKTKKEMGEFVLNYLSPQKINKKNLHKKEWLQKYNYFVVGSDQIWNVFFSVYPDAFLQFAPRNKRIALAVSFGISEIPKYNQRSLSKMLNGFNYISVREESGVEIVKKYSKTKVCRIADPTFIYRADEWRAFFKRKKTLFRKYIFVHFLNKPSQIAMDSIKWLSAKQNLDVIALGYNYDCFGKLERFIYRDGNPADYVFFIDNAEYVMTDSFHSTLFSINFSKRFFVFQRLYSVTNQSSRISDLLKRFTLENRFINNLSELKKNCSLQLSKDVLDVLERERTKIRYYIKQFIQGKVPETLL